MPHLEARRIYDEHLVKASQAAKAGDFGSVLARFAIPCQIVLADQEVVVTSKEALRGAMADYAGRLKTDGVVAEREWCTKAEPVAGMRGLIAGIHISEWRYADGRPPYQFANQMVLSAFHDGWKILWLRSELALSEVEVLSTGYLAKQAQAVSQLGAR